MPIAGILGRKIIIQLNQLLSQNHDKAGLKFA
jgi:hypothetical protein